MTTGPRAPLFFLFLRDIITNLLFSSVKYRYIQTMAPWDHGFGGLHHESLSRRVFWLFQPRHGASASPRSPAGCTGRFRVAKSCPPSCPSRRGTSLMTTTTDDLTATLAIRGAMIRLCTWCGTAYEPRRNGGKPQRFCSASCRRAFNTGCRVYAAAEVDAGRVSVSALKIALEQRARWLQRDLASGGTQAPETRKRPERPPAPLAPVVVEAAR